MDKELRFEQGQRFTRLLSLQSERAVVNLDTRTAELAFSSEAPYERSWGIEVLDHGPQSIQLGRLKSGGPLLMDHDARDVVGVIEDVRIGPDRVGRATVRFGKSARASEVWQDVIDGIRRNVSVGYVIHEAALEEERDGVGTYRVTRWEPFEVSLVAVPADPTVGVGRSADETNTDAPPSPEGEAVEEVRVESTEDDPQPAAAADPHPQPEIHMENQETVVADRSADVKEIINLGELHKSHGGVEVAMSALQRGESLEQFRRTMLDHLANLSKPSADIGMSRAEVKRYSFLRAIHALANPHDARAQEAAGFEIEASRAAAEVLGRSSRGITIPADVLRRDLMTTPAADGGATVSTDLLSADFITLLRNAMVLSGLGTRMMTGLVGNIAIPRHTGAATAYWVNEGIAPTESQQAFDQVPMSPKTVGAFTDISRKLLLQSSLDVEAMVRMDLATVLGLEIERAAINGSGTSPEPRGILNTMDVPVVALGTNGGDLSWDAVVNMESEVAHRNADIGSLNYLTNAKVRGKLKRTFIDGPGSGERVWAGTSVNGYNAAVTNAVPSNITKGTGTNLSALIFGNWSDLCIGMWGGLDLMVDPYTASTSGTVRVVALQDVDVALRHPESFSVIKDAKTV
jgi:HK97 family phage major capsid protein